MLEKVVLQATKALNGCDGWIFLLGENKESLRCEACLIRRHEQEGVELPYGEGLLTEAVQRAQPLIFTKDRTRGEGEEIFFEDSSSLIAAPIFDEGDMRGVLLVGRDEKQGAFGEGAFQIIEHYSQQAMMALHNQALVDEPERRESQLNRLNQLTRDLLTADDLLSLASIVATHLAGFLPVEGCLLAKRVSNGQVSPAAIYAACGQPAHDVSQHEAFRALAEKLFESDIPSGYLDRSEMGISDPAIAGMLPPHAAYILPHMGGIEALGGAALFIKDGSSVGDWEATLLEQLSHVVGFAMDRIQTLEKDHGRRKLFDAIREASIRLTSSLELEVVLDAILSQTLELIHADDAHIFFYEEGQLSFAAARWGDGRQMEPFSSPRESGITYTAALSGERIVTPDANKAPFFQDWQWGGAIISLPLRMGGQVVGVMNVAFDQPHPFEEDELRILDLLSVQAAIALQNARLFERIDGDRLRVRLLYELTNALVTELNDVDILQRAIDLTTSSLGASCGEAFLYEQKRRRLHLAAISGIEDASADEEITKLDLRVERGLESWVIEHRKPAIVKDLAQDQRWSSSAGIAEGVQSALSAPILAGNDLFGVITVSSKKAFKEDQMDLLEAIGRQAGLAISNARRYRQIERRFTELSALQQVAKVINSRLEMQPLLEEIVDQVHQVLGYPIVEIYLVEGENLLLNAAHGSEDHRQECIPLASGIIGRVARENCAVFLADVSLDPDYLAGIPDTQVEIAVPLRKGNIVIGVLNVEAPDPSGLDEEDFRLLQLLADQVAVAIEHASLYDHLRDQAQSLENTVSERTAALAEALDQARVAERLKTQFVVDVSHELRTPLANIRLYLELLSFGNPDRYAEYIETLLRETDRLVILIEDLLAISRLDVGTAAPQFKAQDLNLLVRSLIEDRTRLLNEKSLQVTLDLLDGLPAVRADEHMITQVIANLATNAMNYTRPGGCITISSRFLQEEGLEWVTLSVADTGIGISADEQDRIFERFFRGSASRMMPVPGTGLGLAICKEILDRHEGRITLESQEGIGSEFTVWLPVYQPKEEAHS